MNRILTGLLIALALSLLLTGCGQADKEEETTAMPALTSGLFMPLLAATLLWLNSRRRLVGELKNGLVATATLVLALFLFAVIAGRQLIDLF